MSTTWSEETLNQLFATPFLELMYRAQTVHHQHFEMNAMEYCTLSSIKTGGCPEDCAYCPQSAHYQTDVEREGLLDVDVIVAQARAAKAQGAKRFCMGAAWRSPPKKAMPALLDLIPKIKALGLETCLTLGMLDAEQSQALNAAGLDYYNHNLDTSPAYYEKIIQTRTYQDRLDTLSHVAKTDIKVCCGGIVGMGESRIDRVNFLLALTQLSKAPDSIPINRLIATAGTPLADEAEIDDFELIRMIACTRIVFPMSMVRLSAGRETMSDLLQTLCFMAGANSVFMGEKLLTANNAQPDRDEKLMQTLGMSFTNSTHDQSFSVA